MKNAVALPFGILALAAVIAGCGSSNNAAISTGVATPAPTPSTMCTTPPGYQIQMVFPQNGATAQPNVQGVVFAISPSPLPTSWFIYARSNFGSTYGSSSVSALATAAPSATPFPTPSDTPSFTPALYESANLGKFATSTTFTIYLANTNCYPGLQESTFTTATTDTPTATPSPSST